MGCDDFFLRAPYTSRLASGWVASLFWFSCYWLWNLVLSGFFISFWTHILEEDLTLRDALWFAYVSTTTIGFGDTHIPHAYVEWYDMLWIPLSILVGFVLFANFGLKLGERMWHSCVKRFSSMSLEDLLRQRRARGY